MSRKAGVGENGKFGEYSYEVAKGSLGEWRFWPNGILGENGEYGEHSPKS